MKNINFRAIIIVYVLVTVSAHAQKTYNLQKAIQTAKAFNPTLKTEHFNIDKAGADVVTSRLRPNPSLNNQTLQLTSNKYYPENTNWYNARNRQVWWQLTKTVQFPNQRHYRIQVAEQALRLEASTYVDVERNLLHDAANKWLAAMSAQKRVSSLQKAKANIDTLVKINQLRFKNLVISESDVIRTEILANQYELLLKTALSESLNRLKELKLVLGVVDSIQIDMNDSINFQSVPSLDSLLNYSLNNRADILEAKASLYFSESNIKLQRSLAIPQPILGGIWNPQNTIPYLGFFGTIEIPVFNRNQGEIIKSEVRKNQAIQNMLAIQSLIDQEVRVSYSSFIISHENLKEFEFILKQADAVLASVRYSYLKGGTTMVDFLDAQKSRLQIQGQYGTVLRQYRQNYIDLLYHTGLINN